MNVTKALVIGLGSTGTAICELLADRIQWELGSLSRAPWVRFLCIETNGNNRPDLIPYEDFVPLTISAVDYKNLLSNTAAYDQRIRLTKWAHMATLGKLRDQGIAQGAGNIRMVGRLAFLYPSNYERVHSRVLAHLSYLRQLSRGEVEEAFGTNEDGSKEEFSFANNGKMVIYVVGTLCGGTCSGLAADFGYFVNLDSNEDETKIAIFMLPHPNLTPDIQSSSARWKKNAYSALVELNQYHVVKRDHTNDAEILFPDGRTALLTRAPYDYVFLATPREPMTQFYDQMNRAIADYIFLNIFVPSTLPMARGVDAPEVPDRENQAHVFCTLGLSTLEFPAQQVIQACTYRQAAYALRTWCTRPIDNEQVESWLNSIGLEWESIKRLLFERDGQDVVDTLAQQMGKEAQDKAWRSTENAQAVVREFRRLFTQQAQEGGSTTLSLWDTAMSNRQKVAETILDNLRNRIQTLLSDYRYGPRAVEALLHGVENRLQELQDAQVSLQDVSKPLDDLLNALRRTRRGWFWRFFKQDQTRAMILSIPRHILEESDVRKDALVAQALRDQVTSTGTVDRGIASRIRDHIRLYRIRASNLVERLRTTENRLQQQSDELARNEPNINGEVLFEPDHSGQGTVTQEFRRCLELDAGTTGKTWEEQRDVIAERIVRSLSGLHRFLVLPPSAPPDSDWLKKPMDINDPDDWLVPELRQQMLEEARRPFLRLRGEDVLERWASLKGARDAKAQTAVRKASSFLDLDEVLATAGGRSPIMRRKLILVPDTPGKDRLLNVVQAEFSEATVDVSPDRYRIAFVQEQFRFPLRGVRSVVGSNGIAYAHCNDFDTFFTRVDVPWLGVTDDEVRRLREAEEIVTVATLLEIIKPAQGAMTFEVSPEGFGDDGKRRLPLSFVRASVMLARAETDLNGRSLRKAMETLRAKIQQEREQWRDQGGDEQFIRHLNNQLSERGIGREIPDWSEQWLSHRLERYCAGDNSLLIAFDHVFPPDESVRQSLWKSKGDRLVSGRICEQDGYYCSACGGVIGKTLQEATRNGWRCFIDPSHYFGHYSRNGGV